MRDRSPKMLNFLGLAP